MSIHFRGLVKQLPKTGEPTPKPQIPQKMGVKPPNPLLGLGVNSLKKYLKKMPWCGK
jgi:hypothetical protein